MWGQSPNSMFWFITLQKTITSNNSLKSITKKRYILKFEDNNLVDTIILMTHSLTHSLTHSINNLLPPISKKWFIFCSTIRNYDTVSTSTNKLFKPSHSIDFCGKNYHSKCY